jgi:hypothetical protein
MLQQDQGKWVVTEFDETEQPSCAAAWGPQELLMNGNEKNDLWAAINAGTKSVLLIGSYECGHEQWVYRPTLVQEMESATAVTIGS